MCNGDQTVFFRTVNDAQKSDIINRHTLIHRMDLDPLTAMACKKLNDFPVIVIIRMNAAER